MVIEGLPKLSRTNLQEAHLLKEQKSIQRQETRQNPFSNPPQRHQTVSSPDSSWKTTWEWTGDLFGFENQELKWEALVWEKIYVFFFLFFLFIKKEKYVL